MAFRAICGALLLSSLSSAGCGTVANVVRSRPEEGGMIPFGGVKQDMACIKKAANGELGFKSRPKCEAEQYPQVVTMLFCAADLPISLVGDIAMWPYTVTYAYINQPTPVPPVTLVEPLPVQSAAIPPLPLIPPMPIPEPPKKVVPPIILPKVPPS